MTLRWTLVPILACTAVAVVACGGGGSSNPAPVATPTPTATPGGSTCTSTQRGSSSDGRLARRASSGATNRLFVTYRASTGLNVQSIERSAGVQQAIDVKGAPGATYRVLTLSPSADVNAITASLRQNPNVVAVAPTHLRTLTGDAVANDQFLDNVDQWYLYKTNVDPGAWSQTHGSAAVSVAVIDTGVDETNPDFVFDIKESVVNGVKKTGAGSVQDTNGHGTNTSGLATALTNNSYGFAGVGYATHLQAYKIFPDATATSDCQTADTGDEAVAIGDAVANGASVISLSLGSPQSGGADPAEQTAIDNALAHNVVVVAAAGNEFPSSDGQQADFPAAYPGVIAVGASALQDTVANQFGSITAETVASYSNSGATLVAPGGDATGDTDSDILHWIEGYSTTTAALPADQCSNSGGVCRVLFNGTSQATPQVAGAVALMETFHGGARSLTPAQVTSILTANTDVLPGITLTRQGAGRLNVGKAVAASH